MKKFLFLVGLLGMLGSCQNEEENPYEPKERKDIVMSRSEEQMTEECTEFAFRFLKQINQTEVKEPNWMVSPLSASLALGMITNGAGGNTLDEMKNTLGFSSSSLDEMNAYYQKLTRELLNLDDSTRVGIANSIWISDEFDV
jgi:serpin B